MERRTSRSWKSKPVGGDAARRGASVEAMLATRVLERCGAVYFIRERVEGHEWAAFVCC